MTHIPLIATVAFTALFQKPAEPDAGVLFVEGFDDAGLQKRGWYDGSRFKIVESGARAGRGCIEYHWKPNSTTPESTSGIRHLFQPTDTVYLRFYMKLSKGWGWTGRSYHPHLMHFLTTENERYAGPAATHLTVYVEPQEGKLRLAAQDIQNRDAPHGLTQGPLRGGYNGRFYDSSEAPFTDDAWHLVEAMFKLNSLNLAADRANADGIVRGWFDGKLVIDRTDVVLRSTDFPKMQFNQFLLTPYFGPGLLPHEQTLWIDELAVATGRLGPLAPQHETGEAARGAGAASADARVGDSARPATRSVGEAGQRRPSPQIRVAAAQPRNRTIDYRLAAGDVLAAVDKSLDELEKIVHQAGAAGCDALAFPEDTLGLLKWEAAHSDSLAEVLPEALRRLRTRLGPAAAKHRMYLIVCSDTLEPDGALYNTAMLLGRDGQPIGRYHKVNLPLVEQSRRPGDGFPVFQTPDLGTVGMLICYDMVFPEAARCLALAGADVVFVPTLGGAVMGGADDDIDRAAFRTRAVENFVWLVVAKRGGGSMVISPQGKVMAKTNEADGLAIADIDPSGDRSGGDAFNRQPDMRGRLFRERVPQAYGILTDPNPPVLSRVPSNVTRDQAIRIFATVLTTGEERFSHAESLARAGKKDEAIRLFEQLCAECPTSWIDRAARDRLRSLRSGPPMD